MKVFRVKYVTEKYRVLSEMIVVKDEASIPEHLAAHSDKGFIIGHPECVLIDAKEIPIHDLPAKHLTVGQLIDLIDSRIAKTN